MPVLPLFNQQKKKTFIVIQGKFNADYLERYFFWTLKYYLFLCSSTFYIIFLGKLLWSLFAFLLPEFVVDLSSIFNLLVIALDFYLLIMILVCEL